MKIELTGLEVKTANGVTRLTMEEAKELYRQLHEIFGDKTVFVPSSPIVIERFPSWPTLPPSPVWTETPTPFLPQYPIVTCYGNCMEAR